MADTAPPAYQKEKIKVAMASVFAAVLLTGMKLWVGLWTGSLGILSEAAHSGLDLLAALMTWFSVSCSDKPADDDHPYGHHKIDNLSALFETLLLLATCIWIIYEAISRLFFKVVDVEVNVFSFGVIIFAIVIDYTRGMALSRMAKKTKSAALEADAYHFLSDIASSGVVLAGLVFTKIGYLKADAFCSMAVAGLVIWVSFKLGRKAVDALIDSVPREHLEKVKKTAQNVPGVSSVYDVRVRHSGAKHFIDLKVGLDQSKTLYDVHEMTEKVEKALQDTFDNADVLVHAEPDRSQPSGLTEAVFLLALQEGVNVHSLQLHKTNKGLYLEMHLEWPSDMRLGPSHQKATELEEKLKAQFPELHAVRSHLECCSNDHTIEQKDVTAQHDDFVHTIKIAATGIEGVRDAGDIQILEGRGGMSVGLTCMVDSQMPLREAHAIATNVESKISALSPRICSVSIHTEPFKRDA